MKPINPIAWRSRMVKQKYPTLAAAFAMPVLKALGVDTQMVTGFSIDCSDHASLPVLKLERYLSHDDGLALSMVLQHFSLVLKDAAVVTPAASVGSINARFRIHRSHAVTSMPLQRYQVKNPMSVRPLAKRTGRGSRISSTICSAPLLSRVEKVCTMTVFKWLPIGCELRNPHCQPVGNPTHSRVFRGAALQNSVVLGPPRARASGGLFLGEA